MQNENSDKKYLLTVIVPIAKMAGKLHNLKSWINLSLGLDVKILLIHDFQDEATSLELNHYVNSIASQQVQLIEKYSGSPGQTRNIGIANLDTEWCCFWDADDFPDILKTISIIQQSRTGTEIIISNFAINELNKITTQEHFSSLDQVAVNPGIWRMIFRSNRIRNQEFGSLLMGEDQIYLLEIGLSGMIIEFSNELNYTYFKGNQFQLTSDKLNNTLKALEEIRNKVAKSELAPNRFLAIVFTRMFFTSIKNLRHSYPIAQLLKNLKFMLQLPPGAVVFSLKQILVSRKSDSRIIK